MRRILGLAIGAALVVTALAGAANATNGYFSNGYGVHYKGMAGAGVALPLSGMAVANNPGALVFVGNRYDVDIALFSPDRSYTVKGAPTGFPGTFGLTPGKVNSDNRAFVVPAFTANWMVKENMSLGVAGFGNGGMNTSYGTNTFYGTNTTGVDLAQMFVAGSFSYRIADGHGLGVTPILAYQRFEALGLEAFGMFSSDPASLTNNGHASSFGGGFRVGYLGRIADYLSVGASYQSRMWMSRFDEYKGLYAEQGGFDIPSSWVAGVAVMPASAWTLAFDVQQIRYEDCKSVCNDMLPALQLTQLGADAGAGFGWKNILVFKSGVQWKSSDQWAWRAGYSYGEQPIPESEVLFNILAPGVMEQHVTLGFSRALTDRNDVSFAIMHAFSNAIEGGNPLEAPGAQTIELEMSQWEFTMGFSF